MKKCSCCGAENDDTKWRCESCKSPLPATPRSVQNSSRQMQPKTPFTNDLTAKSTFVAKKAVIPPPSVTRSSTSPVVRGIVNPPMPMCGAKVLLGFIVVIIIVAGLILEIPHLFGVLPVDSPQGLGEMRAPNGDMIGVNDGSYAPFDVWRDQHELALKQQAAQKLHGGERAGALALWQSALKIDSTDAETLIYQQNQLVLESGKRYVTLVACVAFVNGDLSSQRQLQGIYVAQLEHNTSSSAYDVRILIANSGSEVSYTRSVAQQIVHIANRDKHVVGAIGWLTSSRSLEALSVLSVAQFLQVSPQASNDEFSGLSPYFFRMVPSNKVQAGEITQFVKQKLQVKNPVVFLDPADNDSENLATDFEVQFSNDGFSHLHEETFTTNDKNNKEKFVSLIQDALKHNPDAFYFTSASKGDTALFQDALPTHGQFANLRVISGDSGYVARPNSYNRWFFTAFAYPDEWNVIMGKNTPPFFQDYISDFDPYGLKPAGYYGFTRPDNTVILSYDATQVLLTGIQMALADGEATPTPQAVAAALAKITGAQAYQGVSGQIAFDANHDPVNKAVVFLYTSADGHLRMKSWQGCFTTRDCS